MERAELARRLGASVVVGESAPGSHLVREREPEAFKAAFAAAVAGGGEVFLGDPNWTESDQAECERLRASNVGIEPRKGRGWLMIPSGGTSGRLKFARHDEETLAAAVRGFCTHFGMTRVNAIGVLPLHHVSGLMAWMRCVLTGGVHRALPWKQIEAGEMPPLEEGDWTISLVPTQLQRLLAQPNSAQWLRGFRVVLVGGGPVWTELTVAAAQARLPLALSYGMTETAAVVSALRPEEFAAGGRSSGTVLPHASLAIDGEGRVVVGGESLFRGYFPEWSEARVFTTEDLGTIDARGHLFLAGRRDAAIITGGKKVQPAEVEAALRASGECEEVAVVGLPDREWGEIVVACYPAGMASPDPVRASARLAPWQRPKQFVAIAEWPRTAAGKVNRAALRRAAEQRLGRTA